NPHWPDRDRFIMSKGHAVPALYAVLAEQGYFPEAELQTLRQLDSRLEGHPNVRRLPAVEASHGAAGPGGSVGPGAVPGGPARPLDRRDYRVWVMLGDGELDEGQVWEAAMAAAKFRTDKLVAIVDSNGYQQTGATSDIMPTEPKVGKWQAMGWATAEIDGHDFNQVLPALRRANEHRGGPPAILARTHKGHGVSFVEADYHYHGKALTPDEARRAREELGCS